MKYGAASYGTFKYSGNVVRDSSLLCEYNGACGKNVPATTVLKDLSGNGNDATLTGFDYRNNPYNFDGFDDNTLHGLKFNGSQQVAIPLIQGFSLAEITIETYFYLPSLPSLNQYYIPLSLRDYHYISS
jgi:hypothetical protein